MGKFNLQLVGVSIILLCLGCNQPASNNSDKQPREEVEVDIIEVSPITYYDYLDTINIKYSHIQKTNTHDYSENWDFDGDGKKDSIRFESDGGAHLQFFLVISLSSESHPQYFDWIFTDDPLLQPLDSLPETSAEYTSTNFVVSDFNGDERNDIYINVGNYGESLPDNFEKLGLNDSKIVLFYDKKSSSFIAKEWKGS
ncbi:MAG: hypothetical protein AB8B56_02630 [Crocinitomicaceae bacterium]